MSDKTIRVGDVFELPVEVVAPTDHKPIMEAEVYTKDDFCIAPAVTFNEARTIAHVLNNFDRIREERDRAVELLREAKEYIAEIKEGEPEAMAMWQKLYWFLKGLKDTDDTTR